MGERTSSWLVLLLKVALGIALLAVVLGRVDFQAMGGIQLSWGWLLLALVLGAAVMLLKAVRWRSVLANCFSHNLTLSEALPVLLIGQAFGFATPSRVGDFVRANYVRKSLGLKKGALSVAFESIMDLCMIFSFSIVAVIVFFDELVSLLSFSMPPFRIILPVALAAAGAAAALLALFRRRLWEMVVGHIGQFGEALKEMRSTITPWALAYQLWLTAVIWVLTAMLTYACVLSLGARASFVKFLLIVMLQSVLVLIPVTVFGLGIREGSSYILYPLVGIPGDLAIPIGWFAVLFVSVVPAFGGVLAYLSYHEKAKEKFKV